VGTADTSIYATHSFLKRRDRARHRHLIFEGFTTSPSWVGRPPPFAVPRGTRCIGIPDLVSRRRQDLRWHRYHNSGCRPDGRLSYTLTFTKPDGYRTSAGFTRHAGMVVVRPRRRAPAAASKRGRAELAATLAAGRARFASFTWSVTARPSWCRSSGIVDSVLGASLHARAAVVPRGSTVTWTCATRLRSTPDVYQREKAPEFAVPEPQASVTKVLLNPSPRPTTASSTRDRLRELRHAVPPGNPGSSRRRSASRSPHREGSSTGV